MITIKYLTNIISNLESSSERYCALSQERIYQTNSSFRPDYVLIDAGYVSISLITGIAAKTISKLEESLK